MIFDAEDLFKSFHNADQFEIFLVNKYAMNESKLSLIEKCLLMN